MQWDSGGVSNRCFKCGTSPVTVPILEYMNQFTPKYRGCVTYCEDCRHENTCPFCNLPYLKVNEDRACPSCKEARILEVRWLKNL